MAALTWDVDGAALPYVLASGALELVYFGLLATAYSRADLTFVYPVARGSAPVIVLVVSVAALGAAVSGLQAAGVLAVAAGVLLVRGLGPGRGADLALALARRRLHRRLHARRRPRPRARGPDRRTSRSCCWSRPLPFAAVVGPTAMRGALSRARPCWRGR